MGSATALFIPWQSAVLIGWIVACGAFLGMLWPRLLRMDPAGTREHAKQEDPSLGTSDAVVLTAGAVSMIAVGFELSKSASAHGMVKLATISLALVSVATAWSSVHTIFTLHYARRYYSAGGTGIEFNQKEDPSFVDFAYLAFTIGMTFQVSDTNIGDRAIRKSILGHALLSYFFGAMILGMMINVLASLLQ